MKNQKPTPTRHRLALTAVALSFISGSSAWAATDTWTGGGADSTWANTSNWSTAVPGSITGTTNTDTAVFSAANPTGGNGLAGSPVTVDATGRNLGSITFDTTAGAYVIGTTSGGTLNLTGGGTIQDAATMTSGNVETINAPLVLDTNNSNYTIANNSTNLASGLVIGGTISGSANATETLTLGGTNTGSHNVISGVISPGSGTGALAIAKTGAGYWDVTGNNTSLVGTTTISGGTLSIGNSNALGSGQISLAGGSLAADSAVSLSNNVVQSVSGTAAAVSGSHSIATSGSLIFTGSTTSPSVFYNNMTGGATFSNTSITDLASGSGAGDVIFAGAGNTSLYDIAGSTGNVASASQLNYYGSGTLTLSGQNFATGAQSYLGGTVVLNYGAGSDVTPRLNTGALTLGTNLVLSGGSGDTETVASTTLAGTGTQSYQASISATPGSGNTINLGALSAGSAFSLVNIQPGVATATQLAGAPGAYNSGFTPIFGGWALVGNGVNSEDFATDFTSITGNNTVIALPTYLYSTLSQNTAYTRLIANIAGTTATDSTGNYNNIKFDTSNGTASGTFTLTKSNAWLNNDGAAASRNLSLLFTGFGNLTVNGDAIVQNFGTSANVSGLTYVQQYGTGTVTIASPIYGTGTFSSAGVGGGANPVNGNVSMVTGASTGNLVKAGPGTLVLTGTNNYVGNTYVDGGVLSINNDSELGGLSGSLNVTSASTSSTSVVVTGIPVSQTLVGASFLGSTVTFQGASSTPGIAGGTATLTLAANANTSTAGTYSYANGQQNIELNGGTLQATSGFTLGETNGTISNYRSVSLGTNGGTIDVTGTNTLILPGIISQTTLPTGVAGDSGVASFTKTDTGTLVLAGASTYLGGTYVNGGTLKLDFGATGISNFTATPNNILAAGGALTLGGGTLNVNSASTAVSNSQTLASLSLSGGASAITMTSNGSSTGDNLVFTNGAISRAAGSTVDFVSPTNTAITLTGNNSNPFLGTYAFFGTGSAETYAATTSAGVIQGATLTAITSANGLNSATGNFSYAATGGTDSTITGPAAANSVAINASAPETIALGTNTLTLNGLLNTGSALTISGGTLATGSTNELVLGGAGNVTIASAFTGGALTDSDTGTVTLSGANTNTGTTTVNSGVLAVSGTLTGSNVVTSGSGAGVVNESATGVIAGASTTFTQASTGTSTIAGVNTYGGLTTVSNGELDLNTSGQAVAGNVAVSGGTLKLGASSEIASTGSLAVSGGTFNIGTFNQTLNGVTLTGGTLLGTTGVITDNNNTAAYDIEAGVDSAILGGSAGLTKSSVGVALITSANTYTGSTTIASGELVTSSIVVASNASNLGNATSAVTLGSASTTGTLDYTGSAAAYTRGFVVAAGGGEVDNGAAGLLTSSGSITGSSGTITFGGIGSVTQSGNIVTGSGGLTAALDGTLILSGSNSYTGSTTLLAGITSVSNIASGGNLGTATSAINLANNADLSYNGASATFTRGFIIGVTGGEIDSATAATATLTIGTGNITGSLGGLTTFGGTGNTLVNSNITTGLAGVTKTGTGTVTLAGANTYTGTTTVNQGVLSVSNIVGTNSNLGNGTSAVYLGGGDFSYSGSNATFTRGFTLTAASEIDATNTSSTLTIGTTNITGTWNTTFGGVGNTDVTSAIVGGSSATAAGVTKTGTGTLTLAGANTYVGTTAVNLGTLVLQHGGSVSTNTITVGSGAALTAASGNGTLLVSGNYTYGTATTGTVLVRGGNTSGSALGQGTLSTVDGTTNTLTIANNSATGDVLTIGSNSSANQSAVLSMEVGATTDEILVGSGAGQTLILDGSGNATPNLVNITGLGNLNGNTGTLVNSAVDSTTAGHATFATGFTLGTTTGNFNGYTVALGSTGTTLLLTETANATPTTAYYDGAAAAVTAQGGTSAWNSFVNGNTNTSNFSSTKDGLTNDNGLIGATSNVYFGANNLVGAQSVSLGQNFTINSLNFTGTQTVTTPVATTITADTHTLTINATTGYTDAETTPNTYTAGTGVVVQAGAAASTINEAVALGASQSWEIDNSQVNALTVAGTISDGGHAYTLTKTGTGQLNLSGSNTYTGATTVAAGYLNLTGSLASGSAVSVGGVSGSGVASLSGTGTIAGNLTTLAGTGLTTGNIAPGLNTSGNIGTTGGTLHVGGNVSLGSGTALDFDLSSSNSSGNDMISMNGGTFTIGSLLTFNLNELSSAGTLTLGSGTANAYVLVSDFSNNNQSLTGLSTVFSGAGSVSSPNATYSIVSNGAGGYNLDVNFTNSESFYFTGSTSGSFTDSSNYNTLATTAGGGVSQVGNPINSSANVYLNATTPTPNNTPDTLNTAASVNSLTFLTGGPAGSLAGTGTLTVEGGGITDSATGGTTETIAPAVNLDAAQTWTVASSTNTLELTNRISGASTSSLTLSGPGTFNFNNGGSTYSGPTSVTGSATLLLTNTTGSSALGTGSLAVAPGATLGGLGNASGLSNFAIGSGNTTRAQVIVGSGGNDTSTGLTLAATTGSFTTANLTFNLNSATNVGPNAGNQLNLGSTAVSFSNTTLTLNLTGASIVTPDTAYTLITDTAGFNPGTDGLTIGANGQIIGGLSIATNSFFGSSTNGFTSGGFYNGSYLFINGDSIDVEVVPEPSTWAMILSGLAVLIFYQKRRSKTGSFRK